MPEFTDEDRAEVHYFFDMLILKSTRRRQDRADKILAAQQEIHLLRSKLKTLQSALRDVVTP